MKTTVKVGTVAVSAYDPVAYNSGVMDAAGDGATIAGVMHEDGAIGADNIFMDYLVPGAVWGVTVTSQTLVRGTKVALAASKEIDDGAASGASIGRIVDADVGTDDTEAFIIIERGEI